MIVNQDPEIGIHYGVISPNSISSESLSDLQDRSVDTVFEEPKKELIDDFKQFCEDHGLSFDRIDTVQIEDEFCEHYDNDNHGYPPFYYQLIAVQTALGNGPGMLPGE